MPGHIKLGSSNEPDPDPLPYLVVSQEMKRADMSKPYDAKKSVWAPGEDGGFKEALLESDDGKKATVMVGHEESLLESFIIIIILRVPLLHFHHSPSFIRLLLY